MSESSSVIPAAILANLGEKLYEKRKNAALEVETIVKQYVDAGDHEKIVGVINILIFQFTNSPESNHRKGGLIALAATTIGLNTQAAKYLEKIVPPMVNCLIDQDSRVPYYACEALCNIAKVVGGDLAAFNPQVPGKVSQLSVDSGTNVQHAANI